ncbi:MAG: methyltransferase domain-containing protein [Hyphomicrobiaceae bacterium]
MAADPKPIGAALQDWSAASYDKNARFVSDLSGDVIGWLAPLAGERVLDLGCGDGALTERLAALGLDVEGVDISEDMLAAARKRGLNVRQGDATTFTVDRPFDAVFSNAVLHWVRDPIAAIRRIKAALRPGGRLVAEFGGFGNVAAIVTALRAAAHIHGGDELLAAPWYYPTDREYRDLLEAEGFTVARIGLFPRPTPLPTGIEGWLTTFRKPFFDQFPDRERQHVLATIVGLLRPVLADQAGQWSADYVRLRVRATL